MIFWLITQAINVPEVDLDWILKYVNIKLISKDDEVVLFIHIVIVFTHFMFLESYSNLWRVRVLTDLLMEKPRL